MKLRTLIRISISLQLLLTACGPQMIGDVNNNDAGTKTPPSGNGFTPGESGGTKENEGEEQEEPNDTPDGPNLIVGAKRILHNTDPQDGTIDNVFDANEGSTYHFEDSFTGEYSYIAFDLAEASQISEVVLKSPSDCAIKSAGLYATNDNSTNRPYTWVLDDPDENWKRIGTISKSSSGTGPESVAIYQHAGEPFPAKRIALIFNQDDCEKGIIYHEHKLSHIYIH